MDNVTNIEPADNEERLLKGILEGDESTNIEPAGNKERLLKGILEKLGGGGGGGGATSVTLAASGDNLSGDISLADLKTALSSGVVLLSFPADGNADERVVAEYTDDSTNGLRIGVFSEDEYIVYSVVDDGNDGVTLAVVEQSIIGAREIDASVATMLKLQTALQAFLTEASAHPNTNIYISSTTSGSSPEVEQVYDLCHSGATVYLNTGDKKYLVNAYATWSPSGKSISIIYPFEHGTFDNITIWDGMVYITMISYNDSTQIKLTGNVAYTNQ